MAILLRVARALAAPAAGLRARALPRALLAGALLRRGPARRPRARDRPVPAQPGRRRRRSSRCSLVVLLRLRRAPAAARQAARSWPGAGVWPSTAGRGGTITRTVQPPPVVSSNVIVPPTPQARSRMASTPRCMPPRCNSLLAGAAAVVGDAELDAALLERARGDVDARAAGVLDGVRRRLLRDAVERDLGLPVERVDGAWRRPRSRPCATPRADRRARRTPP